MMKRDADDSGFQILTNQEIVDDIEEEDISGVDGDREENDEPTASHREAFNCPQ
jgi:hypothetical protein